jgi:hypothetical protein
VLVQASSSGLRRRPGSGLRVLQLQNKTSSSCRTKHPPAAGPGVLQAFSSSWTRRPPAAGTGVIQQLNKASYSSWKTPGRVARKHLFKLMVQLLEDAWFMLPEDTLSNSWRTPFPAAERRNYLPAAGPIRPSWPKQLEDTWSSNWT